MFGYLLGGPVGEILAPRPSNEFIALTKARDFHRAMKLLEEDKVQDLNEMDPQTGMCGIHFVCCGAQNTHLVLDILVEMIDRNANVNIQSLDGNKPLHFAAMNNNKHVCQVLLLSKADPSLPNQRGELPAECTTNSAIRHLLLQERPPDSDLFSLRQQFIQQAKLESELTTPSTPQEYSNLHTPPRPTSPRSSSPRYSSSSASSNTSLLRVASSKKRTSSSLPFGSPSLIHKSSPLPSQPTSSLNNSLLLPPASPFSPRRSSHSSIHLHQHQDRRTNHPFQSTPQKERDERDDLLAGIVRTPSRLFHDKKDHRISDMQNNEEGEHDEEDDFELRSEQLRLDELKQEKEVQQQAFDAALSVSNINGLTANERQQIFEFHRAIQNETFSSGAEKKLLKLIQFDPNFCFVRISGLASGFPDGHTPLHTAARKTHNNDEALIFLIGQIKLIRQEAQEKLRNLEKRKAQLTGRDSPLFTTERETESINELLMEIDSEIADLELSLSSTYSFWVRDIQGCTALHLAAEKGKTATCKLLRETMREETGVDPVGSSSPLDLSGRTPCGALATALPGSRMAKGTFQELVTLLYAPGDRSILPRNSLSRLYGCEKQGRVSHPYPQSPLSLPQPLTPLIHSSTPLDLPHHSYSRNVSPLVYGSGVAQGWCGYMEDRVSVICPLSHPSLPLHWSLFGVFDGHGGSFCSSFLSTNLDRIFLSVYLSVQSELGQSGHEWDCEESFSLLINRLCLELDHQLSLQPRLSLNIREPSTNNTSTLTPPPPPPASLSPLAHSLLTLEGHYQQRDPKARIFEPKDSSGSTGVIALVTPEWVAVGGVGDSRAVLGEALGPLPLPQTSSSSSSDPIPVPRWVARPLNRDHKLSLPEERERAEKAGASVLLVEGSDNLYEAKSPFFSSSSLRMSRAFGDFFLKNQERCVWREGSGSEGEGGSEGEWVWETLPVDCQPIIPVPHITVLRRPSRESILVLATDGVWDVIEPQDTLNLLSSHLSPNPSQPPPHISSPLPSTPLQSSSTGFLSAHSLSQACDSLLSECLSRGSLDNIAVLLLALPPSPSHPLRSTSAPSDETSSLRYDMNSLSLSPQSSPYQSPPPPSVNPLPSLSRTPPPPPLSNLSSNSLSSSSPLSITTSPPPSESRLFFPPCPPSPSLSSSSFDPSSVDILAMSPLQPRRSPPPFSSSTNKSTHSPSSSSISLSTTPSSTPITITVAPSPPSPFSPPSPSLIAPPFSPGSNLSHLSYPLPSYPCLHHETMKETDDDDDHFVEDENEDDSIELEDDWGGANTVVIPPTDPSSSSPSHLIGTQHQGGGEGRGMESEVGDERAKARLFKDEKDD